MGDIFRGGNQNIIATIDSEKISARDFVEYLNRLSLSDEERKNIKKSGLIEKILSDYIGRKIVDLEIKDFGIFLSDSSLKNMIINDKTFFKNEKFSRTEYEKFLIKSGVSAPVFEKNISEQEKRRQFLTFLSGGTIIPNFLVENAFNEENQIKNIKYINLNEIYNKKQIKDEEIKKIYDENKNLFTQEFKSISYAELTPEILIGQKEFNKNFFNKIELIENDILDGKKIEEIGKINNLKLKKTDEIDREKTNILGIKSKKINDDLFKIIFKKNKVNSPELIEIQNKYYLAEITSLNKIAKNFKDRNVVKAITTQIKLKNIVENNTNIAKKISAGNFSKSEMESYAKKNNSIIKNEEIKSLEHEGPFNKDIIKRIFKLKDGEINLLSDRQLSKNFLIQVEKTRYIKLDKNSKNYEKYKSIAKVNLSNDIYFAYDRSVNGKYKIDINNKAIDRLKNSF